MALLCFPVVLLCSDGFDMFPSDFLDLVHIKSVFFKDSFNKELESKILFESLLGIFLIFISALAVSTVLCVLETVKERLLRREKQSKKILKP